LESSAKERFHLPYADAFAGSLALRRAATLVTADFDFKSLPSGTLKIDFLPRKEKLVREAKLTKPEHGSNG
jgi:hypothetical protein